MLKAGTDAEVLQTQLASLDEREFIDSDVKSTEFATPKLQPAASNFEKGMRITSIKIVDYEEVSRAKLSKVRRVVKRAIRALLPCTLPYYFYCLISSKLSRNPVQQRFNQAG